MRRTWLIVALALVACLVTSVLPFVRIADAQPDLLLMFALSAALRGRRDRALAAAWAAGLAKDVCSHGPLGAQAALFLMAALAVVNLRALLNVSLLRVQILLTAAVCAACHALYAAGLWAFHPQMSATGAAGRIVLVTVLTALLLPPFLLGAERLLRALRVVAKPGFTRA